MTNEKTTTARNECAREGELQRTLLARLLAAALGDRANVGLYHAVVGRYPPGAILCAFEAARALPQALVRKSRGAYFLYLVETLCPAKPASSPSRLELAPPASPASAPAESSAAST